MSVKKKKSNQIDKSVVIKKFVQDVCTPTSLTKRLKGIQRVSIFINGHQHLDRKDCMFVWKGFFYSIWYTEMGKGCEEVIDEVATSCGNKQDLLMAGFETLSKEWLGIDAYRLDKYMYLVRKLTRQTISMHIKHCSLKKEETDIIEKVLNIIKTCHGLLFHYTDVFIEELIECSSTNLQSKSNEEKLEILLHMLIPFMKLLSTDQDERTLNSIVKSIYTELRSKYLVNQSDEMSEALIERLIEKLIEFGSPTDLTKKNRNIIYSLVNQLKIKHNEPHPIVQNEVGTSSKRKQSKNSTLNGKRKRRILTQGSDEDEHDDDDRRFIRSLVPLPET